MTPKFFIHKTNRMTNDTDNHIKIIKDLFFSELWNEKKFATADNMFTDDFTTESIAPEPSNWATIHGTGPDSMKHHIRWWLEVIPDAKMEVIDIAATRFKIITNWELRGTRKEKFSGPSQQIRKFIYWVVPYQFFKVTKLV